MRRVFRSTAPGSRSPASYGSRRGDSTPEIEPSSRAPSTPSPQLHGGWLPSEHTTVVPESAGTTTVVVLFCGAGGLLLLMHPDKAASTTTEASMVFMLNPLTSLNIFATEAA